MCVHVCACPFLFLSLFFFLDVPCYVDLFLLCLCVWSCHWCTYFRIISLPLLPLLQAPEGNDWVKVITPGGKTAWCTEGVMPLPGCDVR